MELYLNKKNDGISVDIDFDELIDQYGQQLIEAIAKRKKALEEISGLPDKDFPLLVIKEVRTAASKENMQKSLQHKLSISEDAAAVLCNTSMSELYSFEEKLKTLNDALKTWL